MAIIEYYPDHETVNKAMQVDDPLLMLVSHDRTKILLSNIDDAGEHLILLKLMGYKETDLDKFFRVIINSTEASWTFVCPADYKNISNRETRIKTFYNDGFDAIDKAIKEIGYDCEIDIPRRYRRHLDIFNE